MLFLELLKKIPKVFITIHTFSSLVFISSQRLIFITFIEFFLQFIYLLDSWFFCFSVIILTFEFSFLLVILSIFVLLIFCTCSIKFYAFFIHIFFVLIIFSFVIIWVFSIILFFSIIKLFLSSSFVTLKYFWYFSVYFRVFFVFTLVKLKFKIIWVSFVT